MDKKAVSLFVSGLFIGLIIAVFGFTWYVREHGVSGSTDTIVLKLGHGLQPSHPVHKAMLFMADRLAEKSGGTVKLEVYPSGQLGSETANIEQLQRGILAMTKVSAAPMESFIPEMTVFNLPYVFRDEEHYWNVLNSPLGKELLIKGQDKGLRGLCYYDSGSRNFYTVNTPILKPDDLIGLKIRVQKSETAINMVKALGGSPTPIAWGELYTSLQQGAVNGAENNLPSFYTNRHYEVCKAFTMDSHTRVPDILLISTKVWDGLPAQVQQWVQESADESVPYQRKLWQEDTQTSLEAVQNEGVKVYYPDLKPFEEKVQPLLAEYKGTVVGEMLDRIREMQ